MRFILYLLLLISSPALADQAADFLAAHDAFLAGDTVKLGRYAQRLKKTPLEVYVSYYQLSLSLGKADARPVQTPSASSGQAPRSGIEGAVKDFLSRPEDTPMIDQLRGEWLKLLGKKQQWDLFDAEYPHLLNEDTELTCYALQSRRRSQELAALREARKLWFTGKGQPDSCGTLFEAALSAGIISEQDASQRLRLALEGNNVSLASKLAEQLDGKYAALPTMLKSAAADPDRFLKKLAPDDSSSANSSDAGAKPARINVAVDAQVSGIEQPPPSVVNLENPISAPSAIIPSPTTGWFGNLWSRLGFNKADHPSSAVAGSVSPPSSTPALDTRPSGGLGAECEAPCVAISETDAAPPIGLSSKLASEGRRTVALFALQRLAKQSPDLAYARWAKIAGYFPVTEQHYFYGWLAYEAARNLDARALQWYKAAADTPLDDHQSAWRVRAALRAQDWPEVLASVNAMSEQQQHDAAWQYWKARALQALGKPVEAREIFAPLSGEFNFYGQLANAELADVPVLSEAIPVYKPDKQAIAEMLALPGIRRTVALYRMGMRSEALEEWRWVLRNFNDRELLTAAEIARRNEMYDRAIGAADKTVNVHDFSLRYLAPYRSELHAHIREHGLDEAWVYGLMRQESRFATDAKSGTGASGLMQIMPSTARWVANKLGLRSYRNALIHQIDTNLRIGTYYMKSVLSQSENSPVLASAAYNAGPMRAFQWRGNQPLEGAIYAETIPYEETREYVKKVMSNTVYYASQFGDAPRSLKQRLGIIPAKTANNQPADNQPAIPNGK
jgi:soluble lytic murein transglycosylase-like protein